MAALKEGGLVATVTAISCLGFLLVGYDNGLMGGLVNQRAFNEAFGYPGPFMLGLIVSIYEVGAALGSVVTSVFGDGLGRRGSIAVGVVLMIVGSVSQAASVTRAHLIAARTVSGVGMGFINSAVPVLQSEYSAKARRGLYVCMQISVLNLGIFLVYWTDYAASSFLGSSAAAWRAPVLVQCCFLVPMLLLLAVIPDTPRWLAARGREQESHDVLQRLYGRDGEEEMRAIQQDMAASLARSASAGTGSWRHLLKEDKLRSRKRLLLACFIQGAQQLGGINAIVYYSGTIFEKAIGLDKHTSGLASGLLQTWFFAASFIPWFLIDRVGRRVLEDDGTELTQLIPMVSLMAAVMAVQAALIYQVQNQTALWRPAGVGAAAMLFVFVGAFTVGFQATVWLYPCELLPLHLRQRGSSLSTATNWILNFAVVGLTPSAIARLGWATWAVFAVLNAAFVPVIFIFFPETKGMELEDVDDLFAAADKNRAGDADREPLLRHGTHES